MSYNCDAVCKYLWKKSPVARKLVGENINVLRGIKIIQTEAHFFILFCAGILSVEASCYKDYDLSALFIALKYFVVLLKMTKTILVFQHVCFDVRLVDLKTKGLQ